MALVNLPPAGTDPYYYYMESLDTEVRAVLANYDSVVHAVLWNGLAYPARPTGVAGGFVEYYGPSEPTTWLDGDRWTQE